MFSKHDKTLPTGGWLSIATTSRLLEKSKSSTGSDACDMWSSELESSLDTPSCPATEAPANGPSAPSSNANAVAARICTFGTAAATTLGATPATTATHTYKHKLRLRLRARLLRERCRNAQPATTNRAAAKHMHTAGLASVVSPVRARASALFWAGPSLFPASCTSWLAPSAFPSKSGFCVHPTSSVCSGALCLDCPVPSNRTSRAVDPCAQPSSVPCACAAAGTSRAHTHTTATITHALAHRPRIRPPPLRVWWHATPQRATINRPLACYNAS